MRLTRGIFTEAGSEEGGRRHGNPPPRRCHILTFSTEKHLQHQRISGIASPWNQFLPINNLFPFFFKYLIFNTEIQLGSRIRMSVEKISRISATCQEFDPK